MNKKDNVVYIDLWKILLIAVIIVCCILGVIYYFHINSVDPNDYEFTFIKDNINNEIVVILTRGEMFYNDVSIVSNSIILDSRFYDFEKEDSNDIIWEEGEKLYIHTISNCVLMCKFTKLLEL